jgi:hypothetical protein
LKLLLEKAMVCPVDQDQLHGDAGTEEEGSGCRM